MDIQEDKIRMNLAYLKVVSEKLRRKPRTHKIRFTFYTENTFR